MSDDAFHREIAGILTNLRDAHTAYVAPSPLAGAAARLPFLVEQFGPDTAPRFIVSKVIRELVPDTQFSEGVELIEWNGVPIADAVRRRGESERGGRPDSAMARALDSLTFRPLGIGPPPDERWVIVGYRAARRQPDSRAPLRVALHRPRPGARRGPPDCSCRGGDGDPPGSRPGATRQEAVVQRRVVGDRASRSRRCRRCRGRRQRLDHRSVPGQRVGPSRVTSGGHDYGYLRLWSFELADDDGFIAEVMRLLGRTSAGRADHRPARQPRWVDLGGGAAAAAVHAIADLADTVLDHRHRSHPGDDRRPAEPPIAEPMATNAARRDRHRRGVLAVGADHAVRTVQRHRPGVRRARDRGRRLDDLLGGRPVRRRLRRQRDRHRGQRRSGDGRRRRQRLVGRHVEQRARRHAAPIASAAEGCGVHACPFAEQRGSAPPTGHRSKTSASSAIAPTR